ncbi:hypothetical protein KPATCC21470_6520 [Kitasatospora purpeofusca]
MIRALSPAGLAAPRNRAAGWRRRVRRCGRRRPAPRDIV